MRCRRDERGATLVELLVVLALMSVVAATAAGVIYSATTATTRASKDVAAEREAIIALRRLTQDVRAANPILGSYPGTTACAAGTYPAGYSSCLHFVITKNAAAPATCTAPGGQLVAAPYTRVALGLKNGKVMMDRLEYDATCTQVSARTGVVLVENVVNTSSQPLFRYYTNTGAPLAAGTAPYDAGSARITLFVRYFDRPGVPALELSSYAALRNNR